MADHILPTRIVLRYASYQDWMNSDVILKLGEAGIASFPRNRIIDSLSNATPDNTPPAIGIKIGDGHSYFSELPWVQAIAADVYNWAKASVKPSYSANEIGGLQTFVEEHAPAVPGDGTVSPRIYQITQGTGDNANKYYLQYKESTEANTWITDTNHYIDLSDLMALFNWVGSANLAEYPNMLTMTGVQTYNILGTLDYTDTERTNMFVTSVNEVDGVINVNRARPSFENISGILGIAQGGTGRATIPLGEVLIGNDNNTILTRPIAEEIAANNHLVPNFLIKAYVDNAVSGITGAMHFIGEAAVPITGANDPHIDGYTFASAQPGDVIIYDSKEYVWTGGIWRLLGDEGSYAIKGSIRDADIDTDANIQQSKIYNLIETLNSKVNVESGKGLSSNDYTNEDKIKLGGIESGAQRNRIEHILLNSTEVLPRTIDGIDNVVDLTISEFDQASREKLATIDTGAQVNVLQSITLNGTVQPIDANKNINLLINEFTPVDQAKLLSIESGAQINIIEHIKVDGVEIVPDNNKTILLTTDPHTEHINIIEGIQVNGTRIFPDANKIVNLAISEITQEQINKLDSIESGAQVNIIESIAVNGTTYQPDENKQISIVIDQAALNLNVLEGAIIPSGNTTEEVLVVNKKLSLARVAATGNISDILQTVDTYVLFDCGTSTDVI